MAVMQVQRFSDSSQSSVAFTDSLSTTGGFGFNCYSSGVILVESVTGTPTLTFYVKTDSQAAAYQMFTAAGAAVTLAVAAGRAYPIPAELAGANYVMATAGTGTAANVRVIVKG